MRNCFLLDAVRHVTEQFKENLTDMQDIYVCALESKIADPLRVSQKLQNISARGNFPNPNKFTIKCLFTNISNIGENRFHSETVIVNGYEFQFFIKKTEKTLLDF